MKQKLLLFLAMLFFGVASAKNFISDNINYNETEAKTVEAGPNPKFSGVTTIASVVENNGVNYPVTPLIINNNIFDSVNRATCALYAPIESISDYQLASVWGNFSSRTIPITAVYSVSVLANGTYGTGQNLDFIVNFNREVIIYGSPQIAITIGSTTRLATYISGSGTVNLLFSYTVQSGDNDADGIIINSLSLNGGAIRDLADNDADLNLNNVGATKDILVKTIVPSENNVLYVNKNATGNQTGNSWQNAIMELADALRYAKQQDNFTSTTPLKIFVAGGTYKPLYSPIDGASFGTDQNRDNTFLMVNNVQVYGGFAGDENTLEERDLSLTVNQTILSGDLGIANDITDNAYHVIVSAGEVGTARLDGFTITKGYANSTGRYVANTKEAYSCSGAGIYNSESNPFYKNLIIKENICLESGGGMFSYMSTPNLQNVTIQNNQAKDGGGMANQYKSFASLLNVSIKNNNASESGSGLYNVDNSSATLTNASIVGNRATINSEIVAGCESQNSSVTLKNSIVWDELTGTFTAQYSLIKNKSNTDNGNIDATNLTEAKLFNNAANDDYSLKNTSPAVNAGDNNLYTGTLATDKDLAGNARIFDGSPTIDVIDMGAYELQENLFKPAPTAKYLTQVFAGDDKTLTNLQVSGTAIKWYTAATGGSVLAITTELADATTYYATQTIDEVESTKRVAITAKRISDANQNMLAGSTVANLVSTPTTGSTATWFSAANGGTALNSTDVLGAGMYYVEQNTPETIEILGSGFTAIQDMVVLEDGKILLSDAEENAIKRMDADGTNIVTLGSGFNYPCQIAVQSDGKILVADRNNGMIKRMDADGTNIVTLGTGFNGATGIAIQSDGKIVVADSENNLIKRMDADGMNIITLASGFKYPSRIAIQADGKIVVADRDNNLIKRMDADGTNIETLGSGFTLPNGIAIQSDGKIVVADSDNGAIKRMDADGTNIVTLVSGLRTPTSAIIQSDNKIVVANLLDNEIKRITTASSTNRVAVTVDLSPTISTLLPADDATDVASANNLAVTFDQNVVKGTGNITIYDTSDDSVIETIDVTTANVTVTDAIVTINPTSNLEKSKTYYVKIAATAFKNVAGNTFAGILDKTTWSFATELKIAPTVTFADFTKTYGDANFNLAASSNSTGAISYEVVIGGTGSVTLSGTNNTMVTIGNAGTVTLKATVAADANYSEASQSVTLTISQKEITVTATSGQTKVYHSTDPAFTYTASETLATGNTFSGSLSRVAGENVGTYAYTIGDLSAGSNYAVTLIDSNTFAITAKSITVTADASQTKVYRSTDPAFTFTASEALASGNTFNGSLSRVAGENVGTYAYTIGDLSAGSNYAVTLIDSNTFAITAKSITVTADASQTKVYGAADTEFTFTASETLATGNTFSGSLSRVAGENVGIYAYTIGDLSAGSNYAITLIDSNTFAITAKSITVTADASQTKVYGAADPAFTYSVSPSLVGNDTFSGALGRVIGENVGTYAIEQGTLNNTNYAITYIPSNFSISKANQVITWNQTLVSNCGETSTSVLTAISNSGLAVSYASSNTDVVTISNDELTFINLGSATVTASQAGNNNYNTAETIALSALNSQPNLIRQQFEDVIFFDNSSKEFKSYTWYKNGVLVLGQTLQYYKETGGLNGTYYAVATKLDGTLITTCPLILSSTVTVETVKVVPNPVRSNASYQLVTNVNAAQMQNARIEVFGMNGSLLDQRTTNENETTLQAPGVEGIYVVRITLANGKTFTKNLLVKN
ncbi:MBG domain-containing protein [Flavobacterium sp. W1B]|uniref:MBG domain-containing protein n=1 Tax=Flavobacterium sp. W1B TaxID=3394146 RepID=UPI0039BC619A